VHNRALALDYVTRATARLAALDVLFEHESWADVVRESQEVIELALKGLLLAHGVEPPRIHDVSAVLLAERDRFPASLTDHLGTLADASRALRRDRELAFYGAADLTPSSFYGVADATAARGSARQVVALVRPHIDSTIP
jgi:HEPN domain-containing protein